METDEFHVDGGPLYSLCGRRLGAFLGPFSVEVVKQTEMSVLRLRNHAVEGALWWWGGIFGGDGAVLACDDGG